jgi:hypothetical protein
VEGSCSPHHPPIIAIALVENSTWNWELKVDGCGLFRWYLNGTIATNLRGCTLQQAESAVRRFVNDALRGDLKITYSNQRIGPASESGQSTFKAAGVD